MKRLFILPVILLSLAVSLFAGEWITLNETEEPFSAEVLSTDVNHTVISYKVNGYGIDKVVINGKDYTSFLKIRREAMTEEKGYPNLPKINRSIIIPDDGMMDYEVIASNYIEIKDIDIAPSKGHLLRTVDPATVPYTFGEVYRKDAFYPANLVELQEPYIVRDYRGILVEVNAFQYNPVSKILRIYTDITVEVKKVSNGGANVLVRHEPLTALQPDFKKIYSRHFLNFDNTDYPTLFETGSMLIICYDNFMDLLEPLEEWKNQKGLPTTLVSLTTAGGPNATAIKNYIRNLYQTTDLCYVLLVGDGPQIPIPTGGSDPVYSLMTGDNYPDLFIGRFSAETRAQTETQVLRTVEYEKLPQANAVWYHKGFGVASNEGAGIGHNGESDFVHITLIANKLLRYTYTQVDSAYQPWGNATMISSFLNEGRSIGNYCGHGSTTSWASVTYNNGHVNALVNDNKLPFLISVACNNGTFTSTTCFAEAWQRATNDVTGEPTGAIAGYMSYISQSWAPPMDAQDEAVDLMIADSMRTFGGICFNGSMLMEDLNGTTGVNEFKNWTIFGDPSLYLRNNTPANVTVTHNPVLFLGTTTFTVNVMGAGGAVAGATVCGMNSQIYAVATTNTAGIATLTFNPPPTTPGTMTLTVTGWNLMPYQVSIDVVPATGPYVVYDSSYVQDDLVGNNNGQLDYAETIQLGMILENVGVLVANNVTGVIASTDTMVTITTNSANFGNITPSSTSNVGRAYQLSVNPDIEDGHIFSFTMTADSGLGGTPWVSYFTLIGHAPKVEFSALDIQDSIGGNNNGGLDPGETADLLVTLINNGSSDVSAVNAQLVCTDPYISITAGNFTYGAMNAGVSVQGTFTVMVSPTCPQEHSVEFTMNITGGLGYDNTTGFSTVVGNILYMATGPDNYGYSAYDIHDAPFAPTYQWVEISADSGGLGTRINFTADDQILQFALPFEFQYYGADYDSISISSNGYVCMGYVTTDDYSNSAIPNSDGPPAMIAPYWEDLSPQRANSGGVWYYYDTANHRYIVEYNHIEQYSPTGSFETFQLILLDPVYYVTLSGDGKILMQYKDMSTTSQGEGTIGIENPAETTGIQYLFDGNYDVHAWPMGDQTAILYTTLLVLPNISIEMDPVTTPINIPATGGSFQFTVSILNNEANAQTFDAWINTTLPSGSIIPILTRPDITLASGGTLLRNMSQTVPGSAPAGNYTYSGFVGFAGGLAYDSDSFPFTKLGADGGAGGGEWSLTGWDEEIIGAVALIPDRYYLNQSYPNPFNPETSISFGLPYTGKVSLRVYNTLGKEIVTLVEGNLEAGAYEFKWNAENVASGIYFYRLEAQGFSEVRKMMLIR
jgi:hypothetical protein